MPPGATTASSCALMKKKRGLSARDEREICKTKKKLATLRKKYKKGKKSAERTANMKWPLASR